MLLLAATTDKLSLISSAAATLDVHASFIDLTQADPPAVKGTTSGKQNTAITTATTTDIVAAPGATTTRNIKTLNVRNKHASLAVDVTVQFNQNGTLFELYKVNLAAGEGLQYVEGVGWMELTVTGAALLMKVLAADDTGGQNVATAQPWFPTQGAVAVAAGTTYQMEGKLYLSRAAGTTAHTTSVLFGGTASLTSIAYRAQAPVGDVDTLLPLSRVTSRAATAAVVKASAVVAATEQVMIDVEGIVRVNAAGTLIPQFIYSAAPGGAPTIKAGSYFKLTPLGDGSFVSTGTWS